ncbi:MAG TPA: protein-glutamate O-methyltransferase CheR [Methanoculleus sp.]|nr:protein-glutamate O-methyltransferase CheR [Methanoculleus sp.]
MDGFLALRRSIERLLSIRCANYKEDYIRRRVLSRMRLTGRKDFDDYHTLLLSSPDEQEQLRTTLTINVTKFSRDTEVFDIIHKELLPELMRRKDRIRIWSAGCATGEEPYSLALIAHDLCRLRPGVRVTILATDLDAEALDKAKAGVYHEKSLENLTPGQVRRHFTLRQDGKYAVKPHLREYIRFQAHDLMSGKPASSFIDIILCRNVTIYFTEKQKNDLAVMFHAALLHDGYYIMGKTEFLSRDVESLFVPYNSLQKIYRKPSGPLPGGADRERARRHPA